MSGVKIEHNPLTVGSSSETVKVPKITGPDGKVKEGESGQVDYTAKFYPVTSYQVRRGADGLKTRAAVVEKLANNSIMTDRDNAVHAQNGVNMDAFGLGQSTELVDQYADDDQIEGPLTPEQTNDRNKETLKNVSESEALRDGGPVHESYKRQADKFYGETAQLAAEVRKIIEENPSYTEYKNTEWDDLPDNVKKELFKQALANHRVENGFYKPGNRGKSTKNLQEDRFYRAFDAIAGTDAIRDDTDKLVAQAQHRRDSEKNDLVNSKGSWKNRNTFEEQIWLLKNYLVDFVGKTVLQGGATLSEGLGEPSAKVVYLFGEDKESSEFFNSCLLHRSLLGTYNFLPTSLHALLIPRIQLFVEDMHIGFYAEEGAPLASAYFNVNNYQKSTNYRRLVFDEVISKKDLTDLIKGRRAVIPGTGLMSLKLEDKASNAAEIRKNYVCNLKVHSTSIKDFNYGKKKSKKPKDRATFTDLWWGSKNSTQLKKLILQIGFQVPKPDAVARATGYGRGKSIDVCDAIAKNNLTFRLYLQKYNLNFAQNGAVEFNGTYQAAQASMIFDLDVFPVPFLADEKGSVAPKSIRIPVYDFSKSDNPGTKMLSPRAALDLIPDLELRRERLKAAKNQTPADKKLIGEITDQIGYIREELQTLRYSSLMTSMMSGEKIEVVQVKVDKEGALQPTTEKLKLLDPKDKKYQNMSKAAQEALRNAKSTKVNRQAISAVKYHNAATEGDVHNIAFVRFGAILESLNRNMLDNYQSYFEKIRERVEAAGNNQVSVALTSGYADQYHYSRLQQLMHLRNFAIHLGKAEIRYSNNMLLWVNVGEIPVAIPHLITFLQGIYSSVPGSDAPYSYGRFLENAINKLLIEPLNSYDFFSTPQRSRDRSVGLTHRAYVKKLSCNKKSHDNFVLKGNPDKPNRAPHDENILVLGEHNTQNTRKGNKPKQRTFSGYSNLFRNSTIKSLSKGNVPIDGEMDVYYLAIESVSPVKLSGNMRENLSKGIYHFIIGQDAGILKEVTFEQKDIQGRQEVIMLSESQGTDMLLHFDVKLKCVGNSLFSNGDLVFLDPGFHLHTPKGFVMSDTLMGLGGYYYITKVNHHLSRDGYETELVAKWITDQGVKKKALEEVGNKDRWKYSPYQFLDAYSWKPSDDTFDIDELIKLENYNLGEYSEIAGSELEKNQESMDFEDQAIKINSKLREAPDPNDTTTGDLVGDPPPVLGNEAAIDELQQLDLYEALKTDLRLKNGEMAKLRNFILRMDTPLGGQSQFMSLRLDFANASKELEKGKQGRYTIDTFKGGTQYQSLKKSVKAIRMYLRED